MPDQTQPANETLQPLQALRYILGGTLIYAVVLVTLAQLFVIAL
ncbi:hypothetical protein [Acinetobacter pseudolwoffii]|nr:hypothetical protein [Acinetobacter pseudolwoffii]